MEMQPANYGAGLGGAVLNKPRELGLIERSIGVVTGLQSLHEKLGELRDKIEGNGVSCKENTPMLAGLPGQLSEAESALRACHSLLDDIAGKF